MRTSRGPQPSGAQTQPGQERRGVRVVNHQERLVSDDEAPLRQSVPWHNRGVEAFFGTDSTRGRRRG